MLERILRVSNIVVALVALMLVTSLVWLDVPVWLAIVVAASLPFLIHGVPLAIEFVTGALTLSLARTGRIDHLSGGKCRSDDFDAIKERMAAFMAHGFIGVCRDRAAERQRRLAGE